mmetsp:Transcript_9801/g.32290  ORF Transcript_9801/g.32290 Transcript_9801/m.32290 type:complete len:252 (+) Transcript_9801:257-1012(+)
MDRAPPAVAFVGPRPELDGAAGARNGEDVGAAPRARDGRGAGRRRLPLCTVDGVDVRSLQGPAAVRVDGPEKSVAAVVGGSQRLVARGKVERPYRALVALQKARRTVHAAGVQVHVAGPPRHGEAAVVFGSAAVESDCCHRRLAACGFRSDLKCASIEDEDGTVGAAAGELRAGIVVGERRARGRERGRGDAAEANRVPRHHASVVASRRKHGSVARVRRDGAHRCRVRAADALVRGGLRPCRRRRRGYAH